MASQITSLTIVYLSIYSGADQRKHESPASLAFVRGIHRWPVNYPHKGPVTRKMFPFDDVIMESCHEANYVITAGCHNDNLRCHQLRHHDNSWCSVFYTANSYIYVGIDAWEKTHITCFNYWLPNCHLYVPHTWSLCYLTPCICHNIIIDIKWWFKHDTRTIFLKKCWVQPVTWIYCYPATRKVRMSRVSLLLGVNKRGLPFASTVSRDRISSSKLAVSPP